MAGELCGPGCGYCGACDGQYDDRNLGIDDQDVDDGGGRMLHWTPTVEGWREMSADEQLDYLTRPGYHENSLRLLAHDLYRSIGGRSDLMLAFLERADEQALMRTIAELTKLTTTE